MVGACVLVVTPSIQECLNSRVSTGMVALFQLVVEPNLTSQYRHQIFAILTFAAAAPGGAVVVGERLVVIVRRLLLLVVVVAAAAAVVLY